MAVLRILLCLFCLFIFTAVQDVFGSAPDLVPMPKEYRGLGGELELDGLPVYIDSGSRQCEIAAEEIVLRISELGGSPGEVREAGHGRRPGIYILPFTHGTARALAREFGVRVTAEDPGPQGYVIRTASDRVVVIGSDDVGTLYGAMTLRQLAGRGEREGSVTIAMAEVYDKPDYRYRSRHDYRRGISHWGYGEEDRMEAYKAAADWMMRFKLNLISGYAYTSQEPRDFSAETREFLREFNDYASDRGIYPIFFDDTRIGTDTHEADNPEFQNWECYYTPTGAGRYYCWSRDELAKQHIERTLDLVEEAGFRVLFVHPVDGGGPVDPELWSRRCRQCRLRFGDRRWEASSHQFNMWAQAIRDRGLDIIFTIPIYPYSAFYACHESISTFYPGLPKAMWRKNTIEYWSKVHENTDEMVVPLSWMGLPEHMEIYRDCYEDRPMFLYAHSIRVAGYFGSWHRLAKTNYTGNPDDMYYLAAGTDNRSEQWLNFICSGEFAWNVNAPGAEVFKGWYYDFERDHAGPPEVLDEWVPRALRLFFGEKIGELITPVYNSGIKHRYIMDPGWAISIGNRARRRPVADVDPGRDDGEEDAAPEIRDSAARMQEQVEATREAMEGLEAAYEYIDELCRYRRKTFIYFYRRMPLWHMIARARHAVYLSSELEDEGKKEDAYAVIQEGLRNFRKDLAAAERALNETEEESDIRPFPPFHDRGDITPRPEELRQMLENRLKDFEVVLAPRVKDGTVRVGIFEGAGAAGTKRYLNGFSNVEVEIIDSLALSVIEKYDCLFIMVSNSYMESEYFGNLPRFVKEGGRGVLFQHNMLGRPGRYPFGQRMPFPEMVAGMAERAEIDEVIIKRKHPALGNLEPGTVMRHMYYDHIVPETGPEVEVLAVNRDNNPVVAGGEVGKGKVIFDGNINIPDDSNTDADIERFNAHLAKHAIEWFTGIQLER